MKTISVEISNECDRQLRMVAAQLDLNRSELIRQVLAEKLVQLEKQVSALGPEHAAASVVAGAH